MKIVIIHYYLPSADNTRVWDIRLATDIELMFKVSQGHRLLFQSEAHIMTLYTVFQNVHFCSVPLKYKPIFIKIGSRVQEETLNKTMQEVPTSP